MATGKVGVFTRHPSVLKGQLLFLQYVNEDQLVYNKYRILEPKLDIRHLLPVKQLDVICTPLVGFDSIGHRLGMGGGYYDRTLSHWFKTGEGAKPIGIAHDCQHVERLPIESWDIPLPKIVTPPNMAMGKVTFSRYNHARKR